MATAKHPLAKQFRELEALIHDRGLGWALHFASPTLKWPDGRLPARAKTVSAHLPAAYTAFVSEVGYPMFGVSMYDDTAWSFLPPALMQGLSTELLSVKDEEPKDRCHQAFFAAYRDLADVTGYTMIDGDVYNIHDANLGTKLGPFERWLAADLKRITAWVKKVKPKDAAEWQAEDGTDGDPHRLLG